MLFLLQVVYQIYTAKKQQKHTKFLSVFNNNMISHFMTIQST